MGEKFACDGCKHNSHNWKNECYECARYFFYKYEDKWEEKGDPRNDSNDCIQ